MDKELSMDEILNLKNGTRVIYLCENIKEIRVIKSNMLYNKVAESSWGAYMHLSKETKERNNYKIFKYIE